MNHYSIEPPKASRTSELPTQADYEAAWDEAYEQYVLARRRYEELVAIEEDPTRKGVLKACLQSLIDEFE